MLTFPVAELLAEDAVLVREARKATTLSYAPYSKYRVGAAVLLAGGEIVRGANQENSSYPCGICAERSVLATAQNLHPDVPVVAIALAATTQSAAPTSFTDTPVTPCGMCRQVIAEAEQRYGASIRIIMTSNTDAVIVSTVKELLPLAFGE